MRTLNIADTTIAQGALTNSKRRQSLVEGVYPSHVKCGHQCYLWDEDDNKYTDYICGLGANLVGYGRKEIIRAANEGLNCGPTVSLSTTLETQFAKEYIEAFGYLDKIKILKSGTEGCMAAVKIALANSEKKIVIKDGYHGWSNLLCAREEPALGIPESLKSVVVKEGENYNWDEIACYILEPVQLDWSKDRIDYLHCLREKCTKHGVILIFDETITGLRFPNRSVAAEIGCEPDLSVMGKALAGGLPISVVGGRADLMDAPYFVSATFAGDMCAIAAARETLRICDKNKLKELWEAGEIFVERFNEAARGVVKLHGYATRCALEGKPAVRALFMQECCKAFLLFGPSWFFNLYHHRETDHTISLVGDICKRIRNNECSLTGEMPKSPFSEEVRNASR